MQRARMHVRQMLSAVCPQYYVTKNWYKEIHAKRSDEGRKREEKGGKKS